MKFNSAAIWFLAGIAFTGMIEAVIAAPPKSATKTDSASTDDDLPAEVPAVPYLTLALARDPAVHRDLKLDSRQSAKVAASIEDVDETFWRLRDVPVKTCGPQLEKLQTQLLKSLQRDLSPQQYDRFEQIVLQSRSWRALVSPDVSRQLGLTADQSSRLRITVKDTIKDRESTEKELAGKSTALQEQSRQKRRDAESRRFTDILTTKQREDYKKRLGAPFDFSRVTQVGCVAPELRQVTAWINSDPVRLRDLRGKVVAVHFWAFGCINCIRNLPHYQSWHDQFADKGLVVIGVHTPETDSERQLDNLQRNVISRGINYPVAFDATAENWNAWGTNMWPSVYLIDKQGRVRNWWYGELNWEGAKGEEFFRKRITELLAEK